jgi:Zn-dependent M16 (insulinase) family peptidase
MIYLYGDGNIEEHLAFFFFFFLCRFDKLNVDAKVIPQRSFASPKDVTAEYSVDPGESTNEKTFLSMNYLLPTDLDNAERNYGLDLLTYILVNSEAGPLRRALLDAGLGLDVDAAFDSSILQPCFSIIVHNSDPDKKEKFLEVLNATLKKLVAEGIDRKIIEGAINRTEFTLREFQISGFPKGLAINMQVLETWAYGGDPLKHLRFEPILKNIRAEVENNFFENLIQKYMLDNTSRGFVMLQPKQGLEKENADRQAAKLAEVKKSLSGAQLEAIKKQKETLLDRQASPDKPEDVAKIPQLALSDVDKQAEEIPFTKIQSVMPIVNVDVDTNKMAYVTIMFELEPWQESPAMLSFLANVLGRLDTENYSYADLSSEIDLHTGGIGT